MTTVPGVFAAGDVVTGSKTVVHAVAAAKRVAASMMRYMDGLPTAGEAGKAAEAGSVHHVHGTIDV